MKKIILAAFAAMTICLGANAADLTEGLVAYYPFNGDTTDASGNGCDLSSTSVAWTTDYVGKANSAFLFDGSMAYNLQANPFFGATNNLTIAMWAKPSGTVPTGAYEASSGTSASFMYNNSATTLALNPSQGMYTSCVGVGILIGQNGIAVLNHRADNIFASLVHYEDFGENWIHVAIRISGNGAPELYVNGEYVKTGRQPAYTQFIGPSTDSNCQSTMGHLYIGALDEVRFYNRALDAEEIGLLAKPWEGEGDGTAESPYVVTSKDDFETVLTLGSELFVQLAAGLTLEGPIAIPASVSSLTLDLNGGAVTGVTGQAAIVLAGDTAFAATGTGTISADSGIESVKRLGSVTIGNGVTATGIGGGSAPAPAFAADGASEVVKFAQAEGGKWTITAFAELANASVGEEVTAGQVKVYAADTVEGLKTASALTEGVTVENKSAVKTTVEVTAPSGKDSQFFKVKFGE